LWPSTDTAGIVFELPESFAETMLALVKTTALLGALCAAFLVGCKTQAPTQVSPSPSGPFVIRAPDGSAEITINTSNAPDLKNWADDKLAPVLAKWYPKISALLPSPGFTPPTNWSVVIAPGNGVAATGGTRVTANATWLRGQLDKQGVGALLHEEVHVVQQYGGGRRNNPPGSFSNGDITNLVSLANKLTDNADPVSILLNRQLRPDECEAIANYRGGPGPAAYCLRTNLVAALNRIVHGPGIYDAKLFKDATLRESTISLRDEKPEGADLARLNRALLEDAYPGELARRTGGGRNRGTGWLTEGISDYIRWFLYEPKSHGADAAYVQGRINSDAKKGQVFEPKYNDSYRISANFLNFVTTKYDRHIVTKLNSALRQGQYYDDIWADITGKTLQQLNQEWLIQMHKALKNVTPAVSPAPAKT
jgi:hypothetical protein